MTDMQYSDTILVPWRAGATCLSHRSIEKKAPYTLKETVSHKIQIAQWVSG